MAKVSRKWLHNNLETLIAFGGQVTLDNLDEYASPVPAGGFETTLTAAGVEAVERGEREKKFNVLLPGGIGWAECFPSAETS